MCFFFVGNRARTERKHYNILFCPVSSCTATFKLSTELDSHIAAGLHRTAQNEGRTANDTARLHLTQILQTTSVEAQEQTMSIYQNQHNSSVDLTKSNFYQRFSSLGWALRTRKHSNPMSDKVKKFIENVWLESQENHSKLTVEQIQQQIRTKRDDNGEKLFRSEEYPTVNQVKYRCRKTGEKYGINAKQQLIDELVESNIESRD